MCIAQTTRKAAPNSTPSSSNTSGTTSAATNIAISAASSARPTKLSSGSTVFISHAYAVHAHHSAASTSTPRPIPAKVGSAASSAATCVNANTNTRSKNSSRGVTRCSCSTAVAGMRATLPWTREVLRDGEPERAVGVRVEVDAVDVARPDVVAGVEERAPAPGGDRPVLGGESARLLAASREVLGELRQAAERRRADEEHV